MFIRRSFAFRQLSCLLFAASAQATVIYSDVTTFTGFGYSDGGATVIAGDDLTTMAADDITVAPGFAGAAVTAFTFSVANFNGAAVSARPLVRFYSDDGAGGTPGTLLASFNFNPIAFTAGSVANFTFNPGSNVFIVPVSGTFWAGITFDDNNGGTGATAAQLNLLGQGIYSPPTIGSSQDSFFKTILAGSFASSNPAGSLSSFGGSPVANFGWSFTSPAAPVPEPGTGMLSFLAGIPLAFGIHRRNSRRRSRFRRSF
jgi:hypothetical protein